MILRRSSEVRGGFAKNNKCKDSLVIQRYNSQQFAELDLRVIRSDFRYRGLALSQDHTQHNWQR